MEEGATFLSPRPRFFIVEDRASLSKRNQFSILLLLILFTGGKKSLGAFAYLHFVHDPDAARVVRKS